MKWLALVLCACATPNAVPAPTVIEVAVTVDDLPSHGPLIDGVTRVSIVERITAAFEKHHLPPVYGFVNGHWLEADPSTQKVLDVWTAHGNPLGNHGYSHLDLNVTPIGQYLNDIAKNERAGGMAFYRYPFLYEGDTAEKRTAVRAFLAEHHTAIAHVSIDGDDWAFNDPYARCDPERRAGLRGEFIRDHVEELHRMVDASKLLSGHDVPQVLLLHAGIVEAAFIDDLLTAYEHEGVRWVELPAALKDPFYASESNPTKSGAGLPYRVARARGITLPTAPVYSRDIEDRLNALCR